MSTASAPLAQARVVDLTRALAGPHASMLVGDLGEQVQRSSCRRPGTTPAPGAAVRCSPPSSASTSVRARHGRWPAWSSTPRGIAISPTAPYGAFRCADGIAEIACGNQAIWRRLCAQFDLDADDVDYVTNADRLAHVEALTEQLELRFAELDRDAILARPASVYSECHASPTTPGALSTQVLVADEDIVPLPEGIYPANSAAVGNAGIPAYLPLVAVAGHRPGETVSVLGATGAVGQLAIQIAHRMRAGRVVGVARDRAALERLLGLGAAAVVQLHADVSGFAGLHILLRVKQVALFWLWEKLFRSGIKIEVRPFPLERISAAWHTQATSPHAKVVVVPSVEPAL